MKPRIIARLDIKGPNLIKGIHLEGLKIVGNPNEYAIKYYQKGADELLLMDSVASYYGKNNLIEVIKKGQPESNQIGFSINLLVSFVPKRLHRIGNCCSYSMPTHR